MLSETVIELTFNTPVIVDAALLDTSNFQVEFYSAPGSTDVLVHRVMPGDSGGTSKFVSTVQLITSKHTTGIRYKLTINNISSTLGGTLSAAEVAGTGARTKVDDILSNIPSHFDKRPESLIRSLLSAIGKQDDLIGGSRKEPNVSLP
jgi:hypothetical protein